MAGVTSRLDQTVRDLDLERATRDDIIKAEVAKQVAGEKARIRAEVEAEYAEERDGLTLAPATINDWHVNAW